MNKRAPDKNLYEFYEQLSNTKTDIRNKHLYSMVLSHMQGNSLLDIGSGAGHLLMLAAKKGYKVEGLEPDKNLITLSKKIYIKPPKIYNLKAEDIDQVTSSYHTVTMIDVLEHIKNDTLVLKKIKKILKKDGKLLIVVPANQFLYCKRDKDLGHYRRYSLDTLNKALHNAGYRVEYARHWNMLGFFVYLFLLKLAGINMSTSLRKKKKGAIKSFLYKIADKWMGTVERNINLGFGLSILCTAAPTQLIPVKSKKR